MALTRTASATLTADLRTGRTYTQLDPSRPDRAKLGTTMIEFPARYLTPRPATPATPSPPTVAGGFGLWAERSPLVWDETEGAYATTVWLAYQFDDGQESELVPARTISREEILRRVWRLDPKGIETRTIDMHIAHLREKLRDPPGAPRLILTVRGKGYAVAPAASAPP